jgi:hypothetical protein
MYRQKARDAILAVTVFGSLLLLPPILPFFDRHVSVLGMPLIVVYVFGIWLALIGLAWLLSRRLPANGTREPPLQPTVRESPPSERGD